MTSKSEKPPTQVPDPVERARAEVARLNAEELDFARMFSGKARELAAVLADRGDQVRAATDRAAAAHDSAQRVSVIVNERDGFADASKRSRDLRLAAIPRVFAVEADEPERQAAQLDVDAGANKAAVDEKRRELEAVAGCAYVPRGRGPVDRTVGGGSIVVGVIQEPLFETLHRRAEGLRLEATQHRLKEPHRAGSIEAESIEQLVDLVFSDPMRVGPSVDEISGWYEQAVENVRRRRQRIDQGGDGFVPVDAAITKLHLEWRAGVVDQRASWVSSSSPAAASAPTARAIEQRVRENVIFSSAGEQVIDTEREHAVAVATEHSA